MSWLLIFFHLTTGALERYEVGRFDTCVAARDLANASGQVRAWCIPASRLVDARAAR